MEKVKEIEIIYLAAVNYLQGDNQKSAHDIIDECADIIKDIPELSDLWDMLAVHINMWNDETFEEHIARAEELIEEITGYLGEYLA